MKTGSTRRTIGWVLAAIGLATIANIVMRGAQDSDLRVIGTMTILSIAAFAWGMGWFLAPDPDKDTSGDTDKAEQGRTDRIERLISIILMENRSTGIGGGRGILAGEKSHLDHRMAARRARVAAARKRQAKQAGLDDAPASDKKGP